MAFRVAAGENRSRWRRQPVYLLACGDESKAAQAGARTLRTIDLARRTGRSDRSRAASDLLDAVAGNRKMALWPAQGRAIFGLEGQAMNTVRSVVVFLTVGAAVLSVRAIGGQDSPFEEPKPSRISSYVEPAFLQKPVTLDCIETPLIDVCDYLAGALSASVWVDRKALKAAGIGDESPITISLPNLPARCVLSHFTRPLELEWLVRDDRIVITTREEAEANLQTHIYPAWDLVRWSEDLWGRRRPRYDELVELLTGLVEPWSWSEVGGPADISVAQGYLVVSQTRRGHEQLSYLMVALRQAARARSASAQSPPPFIRAEDPANDAIYAKLKEDLSLDFIDTPLKDVTAFVADRLSVPVLLDKRALIEVGIGDDTPVTASLTGKAGETLDLMLSQYELTWVVRHGALVITTTDEAEIELPVWVYPVWDLADGAPSQRAMDELIDSITANVRPDVWENAGGPASLAAYGSPPSIVIAAPLAVHRRVDELLKQLRLVRRECPPPRAAQLHEPQYELVALSLGEDNAEAYAELLRELLPDEVVDDRRAVIRAVDKKLIVRHRRQVIDEIEKILTRLGALASPSPIGCGGGVVP